MAQHPAPCPSRLRARRPAADAAEGPAGDPSAVSSGIQTRGRIRARRPTRCRSAGRRGAHWRGRSTEAEGPAVRRDLARRGLDHESGIADLAVKELRRAEFLDEVDVHRRGGCCQPRPTGSSGCRPTSTTEPGGSPSRMSVTGGVRLHGRPAVALDLARQDVHGRRADERGDEAGSRPSVDLERRADLSVPGHRLDDHELVESRRLRPGRVSRRSTSRPAPAAS